MNLRKALITLLFLILTYQVTSNWSQNTTLRGFYNWTKEDPLLTSPDFNTFEFDKSMRLLKEQNDRFKKDLNLSYDIFPFQFLSSISKVKQTNDQFLKEPTQENSHKLLDSYHQTIKSYSEDIRHRIDFLQDIINEKNKKANIVYLRVATTPEIILNDYQMMLNNAKALETEVNKREKCLRGVGVCIRPLKKLRAPTLSKRSEKEAKILDDEILFKDTDAETFGRITGPFAIPTPCLGLEENLRAPKQLFYLRPGNSNRYHPMQDYPYLVATPATEVYFRSVDQVLTKDRLLRGLNLPWAYQTATQTYSCPDLTYLAKITSMNSLIIKLSNQPIFKNLYLTGINSLDKIISRGQFLEQELSNSHIKDSEYFDELGYLYLQFYSQVSNNPKLINLSDKANQALEYGLSMQRLLTNIHFVLNRAISEFIFLTASEILDNIDQSDFYLYSIRNIPSLTYFLFSTSFWRSDHKLQYYQHKIVNNVGFDKHLLTYTLAKTQYNKEEILSWHYDPGPEVYNLYEQVKGQ